MRLDLAPLVEEIADAVADRLAQKAATLEAAPATRRAMPGSDLDLWRAYTAAEAGAVLGLTDKGVYALPQALLPRTYIGAAGTTVRYLGIHILCYLTDIEPPDVKAIAADVRRRFVEDAAAMPVPGPPGSGRRRVH